MENLLSPFKAYRKDGWPLCPQCGEDELWSPGLLPSIPTTEIDARNGIQVMIDAGMHCLVCGWTLEKKG